MSQSTYQIHLSKEAFKFSSGHMTVFPDGTKERLHGHNYRVSLTLDLESISLNQLIPFSFFKTAIKEVCDQWDEKVLLPRLCPFLEIIADTPEEIEFLLCSKRYVLPKEDVIFLKTDTITAETLAQEFCHEFVSRIFPSDPSQHPQGIDGIQVRVDESSGQGASFFWKKNSSTIKTV